MNFSEVLDIAKKNKWVTASAPAVYQYCQPFMHGFSLMNNYYDNGHDLVFLTLDHTYGCQLTKKENNLKIIGELYSDHDKARKIISLWEKLRKEFYNYCKSIKELQKLSNKQLFNSYLEYMNTFAKLWAPALSVDVMGTYTETKLLESYLKFTDSKGIKKQEAENYFTQLSQPAYNSFLIEEHISLLKIIIQNKEGKEGKEIKESLNKHQQDFFWIENGYRDVKVLGEEYFLNKVKEDKRNVNEIKKELEKITNLEIIKEKQQEIFQKLNLPKEIEKDMLITQEFAVWQDKRKADNLFGNYYVNLFLKEFSKRSKATLRELEFSTIEEIKRVFVNDKEFDQKLLRSRIEYGVQFMDNINKIDLFFDGKKAKQLIDIFHPKKEGTSLKGFVASFGVGREKFVSGKVRVVFNPEEDKIQAGEILIAAMTRPEYVPLMKKAKAVITDEGGVTSHAAIVSRELGIPCVIGTKDATKFFKTGDTVVIDLEEGEIKKG